MSPWSSFGGSVVAATATRDLIDPGFMEAVIARIEEIVNELEPRSTGSDESDAATQLGLPLGLVAVTSQNGLPGSQLVLPLLTNLR